jgi:hypothetical protein
MSNAIHIPLLIQFVRSFVMVADLSQKSLVLKVNTCTIQLDVETHISVAAKEFWKHF